MVIMTTLLLGVTEVLTATKIVQMIGKAVATKTVEWGKGKVLDKVLKDEQRSDITKKLASIEKELENVKVELKEIRFEIHWEHLYSRLNEPVTGISLMYRILKTVLSLKDTTDRDAKWKILQTAILDRDNGVLKKLSVIHEVLVGNLPTNPSEEGLLAMWSRKMSDNMTQNPMPASQFQNALSNYLKNFVLLQYMGVILFMEASDTFEYCTMQLSWIQNNLRCQIKISDEMTPTAMKYLKNPDDQTSFHLFPAESNGNIIVPCESSFIRFYRSIIFEQGKKDMEKFGITVPQDQYVSDDGRGSEWIFEKSVYGAGYNIYRKEGNAANKDFYYIKVKDNKPYGDGDKTEAESFYIMPQLATGSNVMAIIICSSKEKDKRFLGYCNDTGTIECVNERGNIRFHMSKH